ncbi:hypothetical protein CAPTEDRAFT_219177 [Capitella teleta]|uniref:K Homology domain-containing protein n=1 Tax=Capitella teleta TaxID=283909 RepID=R7VH28_CAPTE|nr:hypothetical protein CAPTEDRAFT_219177 [Capitella teleta]|eukprot:ELU15000.1 hypothetical protein CAPTEDRAFT_219177 [Capitella teleta]
MISMRVNEIFHYLSKEEELLKKCHQCMEIIVCAKDRQAAEANKNANILLEELDLEEKLKESKKAAAARKREKKKQKKKEKQEQKEKEKNPRNNKNNSHDYDDDEEDEDEDDVVVEVKPHTKKCNEKIDSAKCPVAKGDSVSQPLRKEKESEPAEKNAPSSQNGTKTKNKKNKKQDNASLKESKAPPQPSNEPPRPPPSTSKRRLQPPPPSHSASSASPSNKSVSIVSTTAIGDLDDFGSLPNETKALVGRTPKDKNHNQASHHDRTPHKSDKNKVLESYGANLLSPKGAKSPGVPSPKKGQRKEEGWKEVTRKFKKVPVPSTAISRVIGRGGCNINAIREVSGAHIEVDKAKGQGDRNITIKGSADATRSANTLIMALIKDPDKDIEHIIPKKPKPATTSVFNGGTLPSSSLISSCTSSACSTTVVTTIVSSAISLQQKTIQPPLLKSQPPAPSSAPPPSSVASLRPPPASSKANTSNNSVMTNIGTFHVGPWGSVSGGSPASIPGLVRAPKGSVQSGKSPKVVRQLFSCSAESSAQKTTVTYTSPSMAKTKVVTATSPSVSAKVDSKPGVQGSIPSASVSPQPPLPLKQQAPQATHYSPFENTLFAQAAERMLKKDEDSRLKFATVAAVGVVSTTQSSMLPGAPSHMGDDPRLQAKAPGYKAPRTNSPQIDAEAKYKQQQQQQRMAFMQQQNAELAKAYRMVPPSLDTYDKTYRPEGAQMSPCSSVATSMQSSSLMDAMHGAREEYTTPSQPMTLPRIESNLNPNAPDFTTRPPHLPQLRPQPQQQMPFMNMRQHNTNVAELAQIAMSRGVLTDLTQQNIVALAAFSMNDPSAAGMVPNAPAPHQFSPAANMTSNAASPPGNSPKVEEEPVHHSAGSGSPMSSSAPSPTDQMRVLAAPADERRSLQPIGTERSSKKTGVAPVPPAGGGMGSLGFGLHNDGSSGLWAMSDVGGADWLSSSTPPLVSSATATVVSSAVVTSVHMSAETQRSMLHMEPMLEASGLDPGMHSMGSTGPGPVFANGLPPMSLPHFLSGGAMAPGMGGGEPMWNNSAQHTQPPQHPKHPHEQDPKTMWNSWTPPPM